jgi:octaprenyl-diphosphate synthase
MGMSRLGQALTAREIFSLISDDLRKVEDEIALEAVASVEAITCISRYLQSSGGKRLRPSLLLLSSKLFSPADTPRAAIRLGAVV